MLRAKVLRQRLSKLEEYLAILERLRGYGLEDFLADPERYGSASACYNSLSKPFPTWPATSSRSGTSASCSKAEISRGSFANTAISTKH